MQKHILPTKVCPVKAMVFPVVMYGCESRTIKKTEHWRTGVFELWCWRRLLRVPWTARRSNQAILKEVSPEYSLEGLMLKLKLQYSVHLMRRTDSLEKILMLGKIEGGRRRGWQRMTWLDGIANQWTWVWVNSRSWHAAVHGVAKSWTQLSDWTELNNQLKKHIAPLLRLVSGALSVPLLMSMSEAFSSPFNTLIKLCYTHTHTHTHTHTLYYTKALEWSSLVPFPKAKSSSEITSPTSPEAKSSAITNLRSLTVSYQ